MMGKWEISFPHLGIDLPYVPQSFSVFGFRIALYGVIIAIGVLLGFLLADRENARVGGPKDFWWDFSIPAIVFSLLGARTYYVIFMWDYYKEHLNEIWNIRQGGIAIYGAVIGGFFSLLVFCRIKKTSFFKMTDVGVMGLLVGQIIGRWGNFVNREVFGEYTDSLFAMRIPVEMVRGADISESIRMHMIEGTNYIQVHPTFLYESVLNLILLLVIFAYRKHKNFDGEILLLYLGGYGIIRFFIEGIRTDQLYIGHTNIAVSQVLGMLLFIVAVVAEIIVLVRLKKKSGAAQEPKDENRNV